MSPQKHHPDSKAAWPGGIFGKEWAEEFAVSKAGKGALGDPVVSKGEVDRRSERMKP